MFADPEVDVVQALQGGYGSAQTIPYIDFDVIAANPKPFVGYSTSPRSTSRSASARASPRSTATG